MSQTSAQSQKSLARRVLEDVLIVLGTLIVSLLLRAFVFDVYLVPTGSMLPTIQLEDRLVGEKLSYHFRSPAAGEVVTFLSPEDGTTVLVKRVIATAGQTVDLRDGAVYVDGQKLDEPYTHGELSEPLATSVAGVSFPYTVPQGCVWVMGDNRTNSLDSRYFGAVPVDSMLAHCLFIFWPISDASGL